VGGIHEEEGEDGQVDTEVTNIQEKIKLFKERGNTGDITNFD